MFVAHVDPASDHPNPDFGGNGVTLIDDGYGYKSSRVSGRGLIQQANGKLMVVGNAFVVGNAWSNDAWHPSGVALARVDLEGDGQVGFAGFAGPAELRTTNADETFEYEVHCGSGECNRYRSVRYPVDELHRWTGHISRYGSVAATQRWKSWKYQQWRWRWCHGRHETSGAAGDARRARGDAAQARRCVCKATYLMRHLVSRYATRCAEPRVPVPPAAVAGAVAVSVISN